MNANALRHLDRTLPTPAENLACDEALLDEREAGAGAGGLLRFWEAREPFVVLGYANKASTEADTVVCRAHGVPVLRRCSGGGTVLQAPGCLNYSVILKIDEAGPLASITTTNAFVMERNQCALATALRQAVAVQGCTDLTLGELKFSGNAQRRKRDWLLFHGTFLLNFDLALVGKYLRAPSQQPAYRRGRTHREFMTHLPVTAEAIKSAMRAEWNAAAPLVEIPGERIARLVREKYAHDAWNLKR